MDFEDKKQHEERSGLLIGGTILLGVGFLFLLVNLDILPGLGETWPVFIIIVGLSLIIGGFFKGKKSREIERS